MNEIFFLLFAFLTVFLSIKLSYYADSLSKCSNVSKALIGGIVLAGVTSLPELVTCFSAIFVGNPTLAMGDILGSNIFNIFMVCFFDIIFIKKMFFLETSQSHNRIIVFLILNYIVLYLFVSKLLDFSVFSIGIPSIVIIISYFLYLRGASSFEEEKVVINDAGSSRGLVTKLVITSVLMVFSSVFLTIIVNKFSVIYPSFSSSFLGAIFLGVTTSLPEVVTFYTLISIKSYDLGLLNILGSNLFNLLVLSIGDIITFNDSIYNFSDKDTILITILGLLFSFICLIINMRKKVKSKFSYIMFSFVVVGLYLFFWLSKLW